MKGLSYGSPFCFISVFLRRNKPFLCGNFIGMLDIPQHITLVFILTTLAGFVISVLSVAFSERKRLARKATMIALLLMMWLIFQSTLALNGWFMDRLSKPPHILFPLIVNLVLFVLAFATPLGRKFMDSLSLKTLVWIHVVRIPVEICLYWLAQNKQVPWSVTFEKFNYDIIFGITAPIFIYLFFYRKKISENVFLTWNILGLVSVMAVFIRAAGAVPSPMQAWDFNQPNYAVLHFPFIWLPAFIVPVVVFAHLVAIRRFLFNRKARKDFSQRTKR